MKKIAFSMALAALLCFTVPAYTATIATVKKLDIRTSETFSGFYDVLVFKDDQWQHAGILRYGSHFQDRQLDLSPLLPTEGKIKVRLFQNGGGAAHIDSVQLGDQAPSEVTGCSDPLALKKLLKKDFDVLDAYYKTLDLSFASKGDNKTIAMAARVEPEVISKIPFQFPSHNLFRKINKNATFYHYTLLVANDPVASKKISPSDEPFFKAYCRTGSGHPSGFTYGWVSNDDKNLYVKLDFTPDNTRDGDKDYAQVHVKTASGIKVFKISETHTRWGVSDFTYTDAVSYQHKKYDFIIPLKELDAVADNDTDIFIAFSAYGTAFPASPGPYIDAGFRHTVGLKLDGTIWAWGLNDNGQLGDDSTTGSSIPVQEQTASTDWMAVSAGYSHTAAIKSDGTLWAWGNNEYGQIGDGNAGTDQDRLFPVIVVDTDADTDSEPDTDWVAVSTGDSHTVALKANGTLWAWGLNFNGQLGDGSNTNSPNPVQVLGGSDWAAVAAGDNHTIAVKTDGTLWAWGHNFYGQLGDGTKENKNFPVQIGEDTDWEAIAAGSMHSAALKLDGTLWTWGFNNYGELGDGTMSQQLSPVIVMDTVADPDVAPDNDWVEVAVNDRFTLALKTDGTLWAWGYNLVGQLGDGSNTDSLEPVQEATAATDWHTVAAGYQHAVGLMSDGSLWTWGWNSSGQLGDGTTINRNFPAQIAPSTFSAIISGYVVDESGTGLENVYIYAYNETLDENFSTTTATDGYYELTGIPAGCYDLSIDASPLPSPNDDEEFYLGMGEEKVVDDYILISGSLTLDGTITYDGNPLLSNEVLVFSEILGIHRRVFTNGSGYYQVPNLPAGDYVIRVEHYLPGYAYYGQKLNLSANLTHDIALAAEARVTGRVVDPSGDPVTNAWVNFDYDHLEIDLGTSVNANGEFTIYNLPEGISRISIEPNFSTALCATRNRAFFVTGGITNNAGTIVLERCGLVQGIITGDVPEDFCQIGVESDGLSFSADSDIQDDGSYALRIPEGTYRIYLDPDSDGPYDTTAYPVTATVTSADVASGLPVNAPNMVMITASSLDAAQVSGSVLKADPGGPDPIGRMLVTLLPDGHLDTVTPETLMNTNGIQEVLIPSFTAFGSDTIPYGTGGPVPALDPVPPETYDAFLVAANEGPGGRDNITVLDFRQNVVVGPSQTVTGINFNYEYSGRDQISGVVLDNVGAPVLGALVLITNDAGALVAFTETDETGAYTIYNPPVGTHTVSASHPDYSGNPTTTFNIAVNPTIDTLTLNYQQSSAIPGIDIIDGSSGVITWSIAPDGSNIGLLMEAQIIDHDGIAPDGSSHVVEVEYPNGTRQTLNFQYRIDDNSAYYDYFDGAADPAGNPSQFSGDYIFKVTDSSGDWSEAVDHLQVNPVNPPFETSFSPVLSPTQSIRAVFEQACSYAESGALEGCDTFTGGFDPTIWQNLPRWASWENDTIVMEYVNSLGRGPTWLQLIEPTDDGSFSDLETRVRIESTDSTEPIARIGGTYCRVADGDIFAMVGIKQNQAVYAVTKLRWEGQHFRVDEIIPVTGFGTVTQEESYDIRIKWDGTDSFTFTVDGVDDPGDSYSVGYTVSDVQGAPDDPWQGIGIVAWNRLNTTEPEFDWTPVPGATYYRVRIYNINDTTIYRGYVTAPPFKLPPGILRPNAVYKYRIDAIHEHQWLEWDNVGRSDRDLTAFVTGPDEAQDPFIDFWGHGAYTWHHPSPFEPYTHFYIRVHDAQGVPDNIESVTVTVPGGETVNLYYDEYVSSNSAVYRGTYFGDLPVAPATYTFNVTDKDGHTDARPANERSDTITPNPIDLIDEGTLDPAPNFLANGTGLTFSWETVTGAAFYQIDFYDKVFNFLFRVRVEDSGTGSNSYTLPPGLLAEGSLYRYRILTYREFFEDPIDNGSATPPWDVWNANTFITTAPTSSAGPTIDLGDLGVAVWQAPHPKTGNPYYELNLAVMVSHPDGVPESIKRVEVEFPGGSIHQLKYSESPQWGINYALYIQLPDASAIETGTYTFRVIDFDDQEATVTDTLPAVSEAFEGNAEWWPTNVIPVDGTVVATATPTITWSSVPGASYYKVRIMSAWDHPTVRWSPEIFGTQYAVPDSILSDGDTYGYRVYAYQEPSGNQINFFSCNSSWHATNNHFTINTGETDSDGDGVPDSTDNCLNEYNPGQKNLDGDAFGNLCDDDVDDDGLLNDVDPDDDNDGLSDVDEATYGTNPFNPDSDGDGVIDSVDNCPTLSTDDLTDSNGDGIGDACSDNGTLLFQDDFESDDFSSKWISGNTHAEPNTITVVGGRVQATTNGNYIETVQEFSGNLRIEVDVEKVGNSDHGCWDFVIELVDYNYGNGGVIRFDAGGIDGIAIGEPCPGAYFPMDGSGVNKGKAIFTYSNSYILFSFINDNGDVLNTTGKYAENFTSSKIRIWLAAHSDTPRYIDNVKIYAIEPEKSWKRNPSNDHFYRVIDGMNWWSAEKQAVQWGTHLVTINDAGEENWIQGEFGTADELWIGLNDIVEADNWSWASGETVTYENWCSQEPNNSPSGENAAVMNSPDCYTDIPESDTRRAVLEYSATEGGSITGTVTALDGQSLVGVENVRIEVYYGGACGQSTQVTSVYTNSQGVYTASGLPQGNIYVRAWPPGNNLNYVNEWYDGNDGTIYCDQAAAVDVQLGADPTEVNFVLETGGSISGRITNSNDEGIGGILVEAFTGKCWNNLQGENITDAGGYFTIWGLPIGELFVRAYSGNLDFVEVWYDENNGIVDCDLAESLPVVQNQDTPDIDFVMAQSAEISGFVLDSTGAEIIDTVIGIHASGLTPGSSNIGTTVSQTDGSYSIKGLAPGSYKVQVNDTFEKEYVTKFYNEKWNWDSADPVDIEAGEISALGTFYLERAGTISGRITDKNDEPIAGLVLQVYAKPCWQDNDWRFGSETNSEGYYEIHSLLPGDYYIRACPDCNGKNYITTWWTESGGVGDWGCSLADPITVTQAPPITENKNFTLQEGPQRTSWWEISVANGVLGAGFDLYPGYDKHLENAVLTGPNGFFYKYDLEKDVFDWNTDCNWMVANWHDFSSHFDYGVYTLTLRFIDGAQEVYSRELSEADPTPVALSSMSYNVNENGSIDFAWTPPSTEEFYQVRIYGADGNRYYRSGMLKGGDQLRVSAADLRCLELGQTYRYQIRAYDLDRLYNASAYEEQIDLVYQPTALINRTSFSDLWSWRGKIAVGFDVRPGSRSRVVSAKVTGPAFSYQFDLQADWIDISAEDHFIKSWWKELDLPFQYGIYWLEVQYDDGHLETMSNTLDEVNVVGVGSAGMNVDILADGALRFSWDQPSGAPSQQYNIRIRSTDGSKEYYSSGRYANTSEIFAGSYELRLLEPGKTYQWFIRVFDPNSNRMEESEPLQFTYDPFGIAPTGLVSGHVTDSGGQPIEGLTVKAYFNRCGENFINEAKTDGIGKYTITGVFSGEVYVEACATCDNRNYINKFWNGASGTIHCSEAAPVPVSDNQETPNINITLNAGPQRLEFLRVLNLNGELQTQFAVSPGFRDLLTGAALDIPNPNSNNYPTYTYDLVGDRRLLSSECRYEDRWEKNFGDFNYTYDYGNYMLRLTFADGSIETYTRTLNEADVPAVSDINVTIHPDGSAYLSWNKNISGTYTDDYSYIVHIMDAADNHYGVFDAGISANRARIPASQLRCLEVGQTYRWVVAVYDNVHPVFAVGKTNEVNAAYIPDALERTEWARARVWLGVPAVGFQVRPGSENHVLSASVAGPGFNYTFEISADRFDESTETNLSDKGWWHQDSNWSLAEGDYVFTINYDEDIDYTETITDHFENVPAVAVNSASLSSATHPDGAMSFSWVLPSGVIGQKYAVKIRSVNEFKQFYQTPVNADAYNITSATATAWDLRGLKHGQTYQWAVRAYEQWDITSMQESDWQTFVYDPFNLAMDDTDGDGVFDIYDNCPDDSNPDQANFDDDAQGNICDPDDDNDGLSDEDEAVYSTDPFNPDSDNDGINDGDEVVNGTNPNLADTDGDNFIDSEDNCPKDANADQSDIDGDGIGDVCDTAQFIWDFETGWGGWSPDNGVWEIGTPTAGPSGCYSDNNCAGTVLDGNYPYGPDSRLISPQMDLPAADPATEEVLLRFQQYFSYSSADRGEVQISVYDNGAWSDWTTLKTVTSYIVDWHHVRIDLTAYAGQRVRIGFYHLDGTETNYVGSNVHSESSGWYIDDVQILKQAIPMFPIPGTDNFESGWGGWYSGNHIWELGPPSEVGPTECPSGVNCMGTVLDGNYPYGPDSRLISPQMDLPAADPATEEVLLRFQQYFSYSSADRGEVQISVYDNGAWSDWTTLKTVTSYIVDWHHVRIDLTAYAGQRVRIGFYHLDGTETNYVGSNVHSESSGWYIDDVAIFSSIDSDGDGLFDDVETNTRVYVGPEDTGTDPNDSDTDDDGLNDGEEVNTYFSNPNNPDSDGDGYNDGREVNQGTDPNDENDFSGIPDVQHNALIDLYITTNGAGWTNNTGWLGAPGTECTWSGVTCDDTNSNLTRLDLGSNNLVGTIPTMINTLDDLEFLNLANNQLTGTIPANWTGMVSLQTLGLASNRLSGEIPAGLFSLTNLTALYLHDNQLTGQIPDLSALTGLQYLYLNMNQLEGTIPTWLATLSQLQYLFLDNNRFTGSIQANLSSLGNLTVLHLNGNRLAGPLPDTVEFKNFINRLAPANSDFRYNALFTGDTDLRNSMNAAQIDGNWEGTQTIAPANIAALTIAQHAVALSWNTIPYTGDTGTYEVELSTDEAGPFAPAELSETIDDKTVANALVVDLADATTYYFRLRTVTALHALNQSTVYSDYSEIISATTGGAIVDSDGDGFLDDDDNCPFVYNPDQTDLDTNGVGDACQGIVAYYPFNGNADDASGSSNNGTAIGGASLAPDRFGNADSAYSFDGASGYIEIPDSTSFIFNQPITLTAWIYLNDNNSGGIVGQWGYGGEGGDAFLLSVWEGKLRASFVGASGLYEFSSTNGLKTNIWTFVGMTFDGTYLRLFIDGAVDAATETSVAPMDSDQPVKIGIEDIFSGQQHYLNGIIDEMRIYNTVLSDAAILQLYGVTGYSISGLTRYSATLLSNVTVELRTDPDGDGNFDNVFQTTISDGNGAYSFNDIANGDYQLRAYGPDNDYITWQGWGLTVADSNIANFDLQLAKNITLISPPNGSTITTTTPTLTWNGLAEADAYTLQMNRSTGGAWDLVHWVTEGIDTASYTLPIQLTDGMLLDGETYTWQIGAKDAAGVEIGGTMAAFRFTLDLELDTDSDGIPDSSDPDDDNDGMPDDWEIANGLNPLVNDAAGDADSDGVINLREFQGDTDPQDNQSFPVQFQFVVDPVNGDDVNIGNGDYPLRTLHGAVDRINSLPEADYMINLAPGVYSSPLEPDTILAPVHNVTINGAGATIDGSGASVWIAGLTMQAGVADVIINGLTIQNFAQGIVINSEGGCVSLAGVAISNCDTGLQLVEAYQVEVDLGGTTISACTAGIKVAAGSSNNVIRNGEVTNNIDGIRVEGDREVPDGNRFEDIDITFNEGNGIILYDGANVIANFFIYGNNTSLAAYGGIAVFSGGNVVVDSQIDNNSCYGVFADDALITQPFMAVNNEWGGDNGPQHPELNPTGTGNAVSDYVVFLPWTGYVSTGDDDHDGWPTPAENQAGTDPYDGNDFPDLTQFTVGGAGADDNNLGDGANPLATLHGAMARINGLQEANYTINLTPGVYSRPLESDAPLAPVHNLTINGAGATIDGSGATAWITGMTIPAGVADVKINGLTIQNFARGIAVNSEGGCISLAGVAITGNDTGLQLVEAYQVDVDLSGTTISGGTTGIKVAAGSSNNVIRNGEVSANYNGIRVESDTEAPDDNRFEGIRVLNNNGNGIVLYDGFGNRITGCEIRDNNIAETGHAGLAVLTGGTVISGNEIAGNQCFGVWADDVLSMTPVDASGNWWGDVSGPAGTGPGTGDAVSEYVNFVPWTGVTQDDDTDLDGLSDTWEQQIIAADTGDGIATLADVNPEDDFDGDGWTNAAEFQFGSDPTDPDDTPALTAIYVGGTGANDANLGNESFPLKSLHEAVRRINSMAEADYTISMTAGTYNLSVEADQLLMPVHDVSIIGSSAQLDGTVLDGTGAAGWTAGLTISSGAANVRIQNVRIHHFAQGIAVQSGGGCVTLQNIIIENCDTGLQLVESYQVAVNLSGSTITNNRTGVKVAAGSSNNVMRNGAVVGNTGDGIFVEGEAETPDDNLFEGIQIADNDGNGIIFYNGSGNRVVDCLILDNNRSGSALGGVAVMAGCVAINNNVIEGNQCFGVWADDVMASTAPVDATDNWWGDESGPGGLGEGLGDAVSEHVDFVPWTGYQEGSGYEPVQQEDADADGLPDWWEQIIIDADDDDDIETLDDVWADPNCDLTDIRCDFDGDGIRNWNEWLEDTDPTRTVAIDITLPTGNPAYFGPSQSTITVSGTSQHATDVYLTINAGDPIPLVLQVDDSWSLNDVSLASGLNTIGVTAYGVNESVRDSVSAVLDNTAPVISIEIPTADDTYTTSLNSIIIGGVANDNSGIASIAWECFDGDALIDSGTATGTTSWTTETVLLAADTDNTIIVRSRDQFGNTGQAEIVVTMESEVVTTDEDLSSGSSQPQADPLDLDGDNYLNEDESACGTDPNNGDPNIAGAVPANLTGASYPTDENDPTYDPAKVKRDSNGNIIDAYLWPDCRNPDSDFDSLPDVWEQRIINADDEDEVETLLDVWSEPNCDASDIRCDYDGDGYRHIDEYQNGTDPLIAQVPNFIISVRDMASGENYDSWLSEFNAVLEIEAEWDGINPPAQVWFSLKNTTKLPGRAINDPDPALYGTSYPEWYRYSGYDFGLSVQMATNSYEQGPVQISDSADGLSDGKYTIYLRSWDYGGRTKLVVGDAAENPTYIAEQWIPKGSGINGLAAAWDYDNNPGTPNQVPVKDLNPTGDIDRVVFQNPGAYTNTLGDDIDNLSEYRGIVYRINDTDTHLRLNPYRKDLFVRAVGFDDAIGDPYRPIEPPYQNAYPFRIGNALRNAGIDVHNVTGWGHDFTADHSFFVYYTAGQASLTSASQVTGTTTNWATKWPLLEWEFKFAGDSDDAWAPVSFWIAEPNSLYLYEGYTGDGTAGNYSIRLPLPPINVLIVRLDEVKAGAFSTEDGYIKFVGAIEPGPENTSGSRFWSWATKGKGLKASKQASYGIAEALKIPLDHYFGDRPYQKQTVWENSHWRNADISAGSTDLRLPPLKESEDPTDSGAFIDGYADPALGILLGNSPNGQWDGDRRLATHAEWESAGHLNPFDIDNNGFVELPPATDPGADNSSSQFASYDDVTGWQNGYTKAWVLKHTISHEICHVLAGPLHSEDPNGLMYKYSSNWKRADYLSDWYRSLLMIHNMTR